MQAQNACSMCTCTVSCWQIRSRSTMHAPWTHARLVVGKFVPSAGFPGVRCYTSLSRGHFSDVPTKPTHFLLVYGALWVYIKNIVRSLWQLWGPWGDDGIVRMGKKKRFGCRRIYQDDGPPASRIRSWRCQIARSGHHGRWYNGVLFPDFPIVANTCFFCCRRLFFLLK